MTDPIEHEATTPTSGGSRAETLMAVTNARVAENAIPGSNRHSGWLAGIRRGITPSGEVHALVSAGPYVASMPERWRQGAIRAAAIRAINKDVRHDATPGKTVGRSLYRLHLQEGGDSIESQIAALPLMNLDAAALILDGLIGRCAKHGIAVNFTDLARTLSKWGGGFENHSRQYRSQIVIDFYTNSRID
ncbi:MAG: type I-E CRISPR-associated protein Cse2/CasB [Anaerorhabdus sp.]|uniref:type I-E CRISPR-associated protein Cse2/CasB n=1 Tax=Anaerorhabdus sp. TaxID=1872524 RepID=UPI003A8A9502